jgi:hypothetical protein
LAISKAHGQNAIATLAEAEISLLSLGAMREILGNDASRVVAGSHSKLALVIDVVYTRYGYFAIYKYGAITELRRRLTMRFSDAGLRKVHTIERRRWAIPADV